MLDSTAFDASPAKPPKHALADFTVDRRILILVAMALVIGTAGAFSAWVLIRLIALVSNLVWFGRLESVAIPLSHAVRSPWMVLAPAVGGLAIGLMARFGSEKTAATAFPKPSKPS